MPDETFDPADLLARVAAPYRTLCQALLDEAGGEAERITLGAGEVLCRQGEAADSLYFLLAGRLRAAVAGAEGGEIQTSEIAPGGPVGEMGVLVGAPRSATVNALEDSELLVLPRAAFERVAEKRPETIRDLADVIRQRVRRDHLARILPDLLGPLDADMLRTIEDHATWVHVRSGEILVREGDQTDGVYVVVSGRLRAFTQDADGNERPLSEIAPGESIGEIGVVSGEPRTASVRAIRDSELVKLSVAAFEQVTGQYPQLMTGIARTLIRRLRTADGPRRRPATNLALVPAGPDIPLSDFAGRLSSALAGAGSVLRLGGEELDRLVGMRGAARMPEDAPQNCRLAAWLDEQEATHRFVVYEADPHVSAWTRRCIHQADQIFLVASAGGDPAPGEVEAALLAPDHRQSAARRTLVLLHPDGGKLPSGTDRWLAARDVDDHYHIRTDTDADFGRLGRCLTGRGINLALSGGGARGLAHIGVVRALTEAGVPIDRVAGTSMGALLASGVAMDVDYQGMLDAIGKVFKEAKPHKEYTLPIFSLVRSRRLDRAIRNIFGQTAIEDLWKPYFCVSTDLVAGEMVTHTRGPLWQATRASVSLPGIFVPVIEDGKVLVDGGVLDNLPGGVMQERFTGPLIAVSTSPPDDLTFRCDELPSPWKVLWQRLMPLAKAPKLPSILDILMRTIVVGSVPRAEQVRRTADLFLEPPIEKYGMLEFDAMDEIADVGYQYARRKLDDWQKTPAYRELMGT